MPVFFTAFLIFNPGERQIGQRFTLVLYLQAAGLVAFRKDNARAVQVYGRVSGECCADQHQAQAFE